MKDMTVDELEARKNEVKRSIKILNGSQELIQPILQRIDAELEERKRERESWNRPRRAYIPNSDQLCQRLSLSGITLSTTAVVVMSKPGNPTAQPT
jgi:hypothetical protein